MVLSAQFKTLRQHWAYFLGLALPPTLFLSLFSLLNITLLPLLIFSASIPLLQTLPATSRPLPISPDYPSAWGMGSTAGTGMRVGDSISLMRSEGAFDGEDSEAEEPVCSLDIPSSPSPSPSSTLRKSLPRL
ncbi:hypothetical protein BT69DRAFT_1318066 [Atractiella rhizophila]|nr:hypothetical protein BT69DRAFT_1318066 [Atractiella rhizophila]